MANMLEEVTPKLLAQGLMALRSTCVMPRLVNRDYDSLAQKKGSSVDVPIPSAVPVKDVAPAANAPATGDVSPDSVPIILDQWKEAAFYLTDKDMKQAMMGTIPMQASEAISGLADTVDSYILSMYKGIYGYTGTAGTTPFSNVKTTDANQAGKVLHFQKAPKRDRRFVLDPEAQANALELRAFQDVSFNGSDYGIKEGEINRKLGFDWFMDQNIPTHETTAAGSWLIDGAKSAGAKEIEIDGGTTAPAVGDLFKIAGDDQSYVIKSVNASDYTISPPLQEDAADNAALTFVGDHVVNLAFHRIAIAFATRPLEDEGKGLGNIINSQVDDVSGLALRLEISREHKRTRFSYDILYGANLVRPEFGCRVLG